MVDQVSPATSIGEEAARVNHDKERGVSFARGDLKDQLITTVAIDQRGG